MARSEFPWGGYLSFSGAGPAILLAAWALATATLTTVLNAHGPDAGAVGDAAPPLSQLKGVALVTLAMNWLFYNFLGMQMNSRITDNATGAGVADFDAQTPATFSGNRSVANFMEQRVLILTAMWIHALFVNPQTAASIGACWVATRALYPFLYGAFGQFTVLVELATQQGYVAIYWLSVASATKLLWDVDFHKYCVDASTPLPVFVFGCLIVPGALIGWNIIGVPAALFLKSRAVVVKSKGFGIYGTGPKSE